MWFYVHLKYIYIAVKARVRECISLQCRLPTAYIYNGATHGLLGQGTFKYDQNILCQTKAHGFEIIKEYDLI